MRRAALTLVFVLAGIAACTDRPATAPSAPPTMGPVSFSAATIWGMPSPIEAQIGLPRPRADRWARSYVQQVSHNLDDAAALERIFRRWLDKIVTAEVQPANWDIDLFIALEYYLGWLALAQLHLPNYATVFQGEIDALNQAVAEKMMLALTGSLSVCRTIQNLDALANAIFWFKQAERLGLVGGPYWPLTAGGMIARIEAECAEVVVVSIQVPNPVDVGQSFTLRTTSAVRFVGQTTTQPAAFVMNLGFNPGATFFQDGFTDAAGLYEVPASFPSAGQVQVFAIACLVLPEHTTATEYVCGNGSQTVSVVDPLPPPPPPPPTGPNVSGTWTANFGYGDFGGLNPVAAVMTVIFSQTGGTVGGSWTLDDGIHSGSMSFNVGGLDPACPTCGYLISNFEMTGNFLGRWFIDLSAGARHVGDPALGPGIAIDISGTDSHGDTPSGITHRWSSRRVLFRLQQP